MGFLAIIGLFLLLVFFLGWMKAFVDLMLLQDHQLPGRYDKVIWAAIFLFCFILAPFLFYWFMERNARQLRENRKLEALQKAISKESP